MRLPSRVLACRCAARRCNLCAGCAVQQPGAGTLAAGPVGGGIGRQAGSRDLARGQRDDVRRQRRHDGSSRRRRSRRRGLATGRDAGCRVLRRQGGAQPLPGRVPDDRVRGRATRVREPDARFSPTAGVHDAARRRARGDRQRRRGARFQASVPQAGSDMKPSRPADADAIARVSHSSTMRRSTSCTDSSPSTNPAWRLGEERRPSRWS